MPGLDITEYNARQSPEDQALCARLAGLIDAGLPGATSKVWHAHPVWFLDANPIVGYACRKAGVTLLFWSGQSFSTPGLQPEGKFKAAQTLYQTGMDVDEDLLTRWLAEGRIIQWDYANIVRRKGRLERLDLSVA